VTRCSEIEPEILFRADGEGDPTLAGDLDEHLGACASCRAFEAEARARISSLRALPRRPVPPGLDVLVRSDIEELATAPAAARERWVGGWIGRLPRLAAPAELARRVFESPALDGALPRGRLYRFAAAAASVAAVVLGGWFASSLFRAEPIYTVVQVAPSDLRIQASVSLARSLGGEEVVPRSEEKR